MTPGGDASIQRSMDAVRALMCALNRDSPALERHTGLSLAQIVVLQHLMTHPSLSMRELADRTSTDQSSVSVVVSKLLEKGLVGRQPVPGDKRQVAIALTLRGHAAIDRVPETVPSRLADAFSRLPPDSGDTLARLLEAWIDAAGIESHTPPALGIEKAAG